MANKERWQDILSRVESESFDPQPLLYETAAKQPALYAWLFLDENDLLTTDEKELLLYIHCVLWQCSTSIIEWTPAQIEDLEEVLWNEKEAGLMPYGSAYPAMDALDDDVFAFIIDATDVEVQEITTSGAEWLMMKGFVLAILLTGASGP